LEVSGQLHVPADLPLEEKAQEASVNKQNILTLASAECLNRDEAANSITEDVIMCCLVTPTAPFRRRWKMANSRRTKEIR
jgi:hypothetical protein